MKKWIIFAIIAWTFFLVGCGHKKSQVSPLDSPALYQPVGNLVEGNASGSVTVVEFFDYRCPACKLSYPAIKQVVESNPNVRFVYREFPILGPTSVFAAKAALAAHYQQKYPVLHDALMESSSLDSAMDVLAVAKKAGLDVKQLHRDMDNPVVMQQIDYNRMLAKRLGITKTPTFVVAKTRFEAGKILVSEPRLVEGSVTAESLAKLVS